MNYKWNIKILREFIGYCLRRNIQEILNRKQYVQLLYKKIINIIQAGYYTLYNCNNNVLIFITIYKKIILFIIIYIYNF